MRGVKTSTASVTGADGLAAGKAVRPARPRNASSAGARATAAWRRRRQEGVVRVTVEVGADDIEVLVASHWLGAGEAHDRRAVGDAVARLLGQVVKQLGGRAGHM